MFKGRQNAHREIGFDLAKRIVTNLDDIGKLQQKPTLHGRNIGFIVNPR